MPLAVTRLIALLLSVLPPLTAMEASARESFVPLQADRLPDLHIPRSGHLVFAIGDELVAIGGHTSGFVPTATAEYFVGGQWHELNTVYDHDHALSVQMRSGRVLIAGGHLQPLGIGQTFTVELYDPATHTFEGYGCLDRKRCYSTALEMDSGQVIVAGNWYTDDGIERFDGSRQFLPVKDISIARARPYMLRTAKDNAIIFGCRGERDQVYDTIVLDRLHGDAYTVPLLQQWHPIVPVETHRSTDYFIGDEGRGDYSYLIAATDTAGRVGVIRVSNGIMTLLPTEKPIPVEVEGAAINYLSAFVVDRDRGRAYLTGFTAGMRLCVACVEYARTPSPLTFYCTEPMPDVGYCPPVLNADGDLVIVGGGNDSNFNPVSTVVVLHVAPRAAASVSEGQAGHRWWLWLLVLVAALVVVFLCLRRKSRHRSTVEPQSVRNEEEQQPAAAADEGSRREYSALMERICQYMEEQEPYLDSNLKIQDVADALSSNRTYVSDCLRVERGVAFPVFVNTYRVEHAKQLLRRHPDMKIAAAGTASGFSSEASFFRSFKSITGMSPKEWRERETVA